MKAKRMTLTTSIDKKDCKNLVLKQLIEVDHEVEVEFSVSKRIAGTKTQPEEPVEVEDLTIETKILWWLNTENKVMKLSEALLFKTLSIEEDDLTTERYDKLIQECFDYMNDKGE